MLQYRRKSKTSIHKIQYTGHLGRQVPQYPRFDPSLQHETTIIRNNEPSYIGRMKKRRHRIIVEPKGE